jgi:hypothetical protein
MLAAHQFQKIASQLDGFNRSCLQAARFLAHPAEVDSKLERFKPSSLKRTSGDQKDRIQSKL